MSRAMAQLCDVLATVMTPDLKNIRMDGLWGRIELATLQETGNGGGQVDTVIAIDLLGKNVVDVWIRPGTKKREVELSEAEKQSLAKRQPNECYDPDTLESMFGGIN